MAKKKKISQRRQWSVIVFGAFMFVGIGVGLLTAFKAGAVQQQNMQNVSVHKTTN